MHSDLDLALGYALVYFLSNLCFYLRSEDGLLLTHGKERNSNTF